MMAQNLLLRLIEICILSILCIQLATALIVDNFEDGNVDGWAGTYISNVAIESTTTHQGSYSLKWTVTTDDDSPKITKTWTTDLTPYQKFNFSFWMDTNNFLYVGAEKIFLIFHDTEAHECSMLGLEVDDNWNNYSLNISSGSADWDAFECNLSLINYFYFYTTEWGNTPVDGFIDSIFAYDTCTPPTYGDWKILDNDVCTLSSAKTITGNLNISDGTLEIQSSGALSILGGYIFVYPFTGSLLQILSGGQING